MEYQQIQPPDYLKPYIKYFWTVDSSVDTISKTFRTIADGCPGLIFQQTDKGNFYQNNKQLPTIFVYGQATRHAQLHAGGKSRITGVFFYPTALKSIFGLNADELTDSCVDVELIPAGNGLQLNEQLSNTASTREQIEILSSYLFAQVGKNSMQVDETIQHALALIQKSEGNISLKQLHKNIQLSERSFERRFKQSIGITPKLFSRICRFQASLDQLKKIITASFPTSHLKKNTQTNLIS